VNYIIVVYDVNIYTNCIDTQRDGFDKTVTDINTHFSVEPLNIIFDTVYFAKYA